MFVDKGSYSPPCFRGHHYTFCARPTPNQLSGLAWDIPPRENLGGSEGKEVHISSPWALSGVTGLKDKGSDSETPFDSEIPLLF